MCRQGSDYDSGPWYEECSHYIDASDQLGQIEHAMERIIPMLYGHGELDRAALDTAIVDICDALKMKQPEALPRIRRQHSAMFEMGIEMSQSHTQGAI